MRVYLVAGEPSGDKLGAALIRGLRTIIPGIELRGIAGPLMQAEGMASLFPMEELSVMGIAEVLPKFRHLMRRITQTADDVVATAPDVLITIDSPDFSLRVARRVKAASKTRTVHYVAPTIWGWRPKRAAKLQGVVDHLLALLPFEPPLFAPLGIACDFVGHPVVAEPEISAENRNSFRDAHGLGKPTVCLLPGSRRGEVDRLMAGLLQAVGQADLGSQPHLVIPTLPHLREPLERQLAGHRALIIDGADGPAEDANTLRRQAMAASDIALAASGTVSLELASVGTPMVIGYDMNWATRLIIERMLLIDTVTLVNLVSETRHVEEFLGRGFVPGDMAAALTRLYADPTQQRTALEITMDRLGRGGEDPGLRAARAVLKRL
ncbi:MAG: lipid-A-disaccharide synthase [Pseudomonadota bacterium]